MMPIKLPVLSQISIAHFTSHLHMMTIPALLPLLPQTLGVGFIEIGAAISLFNIVSALVQAPLGFAADRFGPHRILFAGLLLGSLSFLALSFFPTYTGLLLAMGFAGAANGVYHPCDYAILSRSVQESRMGRAFSIHGFAGFAGSAVAPAVLTTLAVFFSIRLAVAVSALIGFLTAAQLLLPNPASNLSIIEKKEDTPGKNSRIGLSAVWLPIAVLTLLYVLLNLSGTSIERFSVSALIQGYGATLPVANIALTFYLTCNAFGVLAGGILADKTKRHGYVAALAYGIAACLVAMVATLELPSALLAIIFAVIGLLTGIIVPSRDMLVRAASPKGAEGKVFGIVSTGFNVGSALGPLLCGYFLDNALAPMVFWAAVAFMLLTVALTVTQERVAGNRRAK